MKKFLLGFLACYAIAGIISGSNAYKIPATTRFGATYNGMMWLPFSVLPTEYAYKLVPERCFDFSPEWIAYKKGETK